MRQLRYLMAACLLAARAGTAQVSVKLVTDEADASLAILGMRERGVAIPESAWQRLFSAEGYRNLKTREAAMHRGFTDSSFRAFLMSDTLLARANALSKAVKAYSTIDVPASAARALGYLPGNSSIRARLYLEIKPKTNTFVFPVPEGAGIFLYVDPAVPLNRVADDVVTHELHHVGVNASCRKDTVVPGDPRSLARAYAGGLMEGMAMLAAAGSPDIDPHAHSPAAERARWHRDFARWKEDLPVVQKFLLDVGEGRLTNPDSIAAAAAPFWGDAQGPWYTVGYGVATTVERAIGRNAMRRMMCDPSRLLGAYNAAAKRRGDALPQFSPALIELLTQASR